MKWICPSCNYPNIASNESCVYCATSRKDLVPPVPCYYAYYAYFSKVPTYDVTFRSVALQGQHPLTFLKEYQEEVGHIRLFLVSFQQISEVEFNLAVATGLHSLRVSTEEGG